MKSPPEFTQITQLGYLSLCLKCLIPSLCLSLMVLPTVLPISFYLSLVLYLPLSVEGIIEEEEEEKEEVEKKRITEEEEKEEKGKKK